MYITRASRIVTTIACYSMIVIGGFDDLDALATLIASNVNPGHLYVSLLEYPAGWRLQVTSDDNYYPDHAHDLVEQRIREGVAVTIANGKNPMPTYIYTASKQDAPIDFDEIECPF
jgi:hypothetical protein